MCGEVTRKNAKQGNHWCRPPVRKSWRLYVLPLRPLWPQRFKILKRTHGPHHWLRNRQQLLPQRAQRTQRKSACTNNEAPDVRFYLGFLHNTKTLNVCNADKKRSICHQPVNRSSSSCFDSAICGCSARICVHRRLSAVPFFRTLSKAD